MRSHFWFTKDVKLNLINTRHVNATLLHKRINCTDASRIEKCDSSDDSLVDVEYDSDTSLIKLERMESKARSNINLQPVVQLERLQQETIGSTLKCIPQSLLDSVGIKRGKDCKLKSNSGRKRHSCLECNKIFKSQHILQKHLKSHNKQQNTQTNQISSDSDIEKIPNPVNKMNDQDLKVRSPQQGKTVSFEISAKDKTIIGGGSTENENVLTQVKETRTSDRIAKKLDEISSHGKVHKCLSCCKSFTKIRWLEKHTKTHTIEKRKCKTLIYDETSQQGADVPDRCNNSRNKICSTNRGTFPQGDSSKSSQPSHTSDPKDAKRSKLSKKTVVLKSRSVYQEKKRANKENECAIETNVTPHLDFSSKVDKKGDAPNSNLKDESEGILTPRVQSEQKSCERVTRNAINTTEESKISNRNENCSVKRKRRKVPEKDNKLKRKAHGKEKNDTDANLKVKSANTIRGKLNCERSLYSAAVVLLENIDSKIAQIKLTKSNTESINKSNSKLEPATKRHVMRTRSDIKTKKVK